jgi:hypothetical protein
VERDFSFVFGDEVEFEAMRRAVMGLGIRELREFKPVEIFRGGSIGAGKYSILLRARLQSEWAGQKGRCAMSRLRSGFFLFFTRAEAPIVRRGAAGVGAALPRCCAAGQGGGYFGAKARVFLLFTRR